MAKKVNMENVYYTDVLPDVKKVYPKAYKTIQTETKQRKNQQDKRKMEKKSGQQNQAQGPQEN